MTCNATAFPRIDGEQWDALVAATLRQLRTRSDLEVLYRRGIESSRYCAYLVAIWLVVCISMKSSLVLVAFALLCWSVRQMLLDIKATLLVREALAA